MSETKYTIQEKLMAELKTAKEREAQTLTELKEASSQGLAGLPLQKRYEKDQGYTNGILEALDIVNRIKED